MKIGFFVNGVDVEHPRFTTTLLAREAVRRGHQVFYLEVEDFSCFPDDSLRVRARFAPRKGDLTLPAFLAGLRDRKAPVERFEVEELDVLLLRNDPAVDAVDRPWAQSVGIIFGHMAALRGVLVLNDPYGLAGALNKLYFQYFPQEVRPRTMISRSRKAIKEFIAEQEGDVVLKPLQGSGGQSVFLARHADAANHNQMIDAVLRDGYVIAQEYLPAAAEGDIRLFLMDGEPLKVKSKYAAIRRVGDGRDLRSNMHVGGKAVKVEIDDGVLAIAEAVRPKLVADGMFLVGLDIAGDKLMEVNVFSPGGMCSAQRLQRANFAAAILERLERKHEWRQRYPAAAAQARLATV
jgi:glutathione synthase